MKKWILITLAEVAIIFVIAFMFYSLGGRHLKDTTLEIDALKKYQEHLISQIIQKDKAIDSLELDYSRLYVGKKALEERLKDVKTKTIVKYVDYKTLKEDQRATVFLSKTQKVEPGIPAFMGDSLLVPIANIDSAMVLIIEEEFCNEVIIIKDSLLDNAELRITSLRAVIDLERGKFENLKESNELLQIRNDYSDEKIKQIQKKLKWTKVKGTIKDVLIVSGIIYILL